MRKTERPAFEFLGNWDGQFIATAIHNGHDIRPEVAAELVLPEHDRLREEDPYTDEIGVLIPARVVVHRSRFEVDLNRTRESSVYRDSEEAWGLEILRDPLGDEVVAGSLDVYDAFYAELGRRLDPVAERGPFVVFDIHSYNHRRDGADAAQAPGDENPEVNVGTGSLDRERFGPVVDNFMESLQVAGTSAGPIDVRENVRFRGRQLAAWTHARYPDRGIVLALEFKKTFMDEWTGEIDRARIDELARALAGTVPSVEQSLREVAMM